MPHLYLSWKNILAAGVMTCITASFGLTQENSMSGAAEGSSTTPSGSNSTFGVPGGPGYGAPGSNTPNTLDSPDTLGSPSETNPSVPTPSIFGSTTPNSGASP